MKKLIIYTAILTLAGCSNGWKKEYAKKKCIKGANLTAPKNDESKVMIEKLCDCVGEKMMTKYKSEAEANKDLKGAQDVTMGCMQELYKPKTK